MTDVACGPERVPLDRASLVHVGPPVGWARSWPHRGRDLELRIDGDDGEPYARLVELAETLLPKLDEIEAAADAYVRLFAHADRPGDRGALVSVRLEWSGDWQRGNQVFEAVLSMPDDDYGEWAVRFRYYWPTKVFTPYFFSRKQW